MRKSIQPDKVESIALNFPDLNVGWLLTGEGLMLKDSPMPVAPPLSEETEVAKMLQELLRAKDQIIAEKELLLVEKDKRLQLMEELLVNSRRVANGRLAVV
jgi:hypothetical protein